MKKIYTILAAVLLTASIMAQVPQSFKYQAVLRDGSGIVKASTAVSIDLSILQGSASGTVVYFETHSATTNAYGLVNLDLGGGTPTTGTFANIDWSTGIYFVKVAVDGVDMGTSQLLSVPYALNAKTAESITGTITETDPIYIASQAAYITASDITKLSNLSGINTGDEDLSGLATTLAVTTSLNLKVDKEAGKGLSTNDYTTAEQTKVSNLSGTNTGDQTLSGLGGVASNIAITGATKTKVTYDAKGLVTAGADATTADIAASTDKNYMTDAQQTKLTGIATGAEVNVQADWNQATTAADDYIKNKPTILAGTAAGQMQYWNGTAWVVIVVTANEGAALQMIGGIPTWVGGTPPPPSVTSPTGKIWMDRNLGASQVATSSTDAASYGDLYQWGRGTDGHQIRTSGAIDILSTTDAPGHGNFITTSSDPYDWRSGQNGNLWQGVSGTNKPCPSGYRLPTDVEWNAERTSWGSNNAAGAFGSPLKLPVAGYRYCTNGSLLNVGSIGLYWSSTVNGIYSQFLHFNSSDVVMLSNSRAFGISVRCLKD